MLKGVPRDAALEFVSNRPTYEVELVLKYNEITRDFYLVGVNGFGGRNYVVKEGG